MKGRSTYEKQILSIIFAYMELKHHLIELGSSYKSERWFIMKNYQHF